MNERIKNIVEQSKQYAREQMAHPLNPMIFYADVFQEKFTQLIVKECADWINENVGMITPEAKSDLLKHFGVK